MVHSGPQEQILSPFSTCCLNRVRMFRVTHIIIIIIIQKKTKHVVSLRNTVYVRTRRQNV